MSLSVVLATRGRPGHLVRTVERTLQVIRQPDTKLLIAADADDEGTLSTRDRLADPRIVWSVREREDGLGAKYNRVLKDAPADVYCVMVDYAPFVTENFDGRILEAATIYPDGYGFILNHLANLSFSQVNACTHKLAEAMGGIYSEVYPYWFIDHGFEDMARRLGRQVFVDVMVDTSKRPGTQGMKEPMFWGQVFDSLNMERGKLAEEIINRPDFDETPARKKALINNSMLVFEWSHMINQSLANVKSEAVSWDDHRYIRIKNNVIDKLRGMGLIQDNPPQKVA